MQFDLLLEDIAYWMSELTRLLYPSNNIVTDMATATLELVWGLPFIDMTIGFVEFLVRALRCELDFDLFGEPITGKFVSPADPEFKEFLPTW